MWPKHIAFQDQQLYVSDPLALHHVVVKEQHIYTETDMFIMCVYCRQVSCRLELLGAGETRSFSAKGSFQPLVRFPLSTQRNDSCSILYEGEQHRKQRKILNPVFSLANMRELLPVIQPIASKMRSVLLSQLPDDGGERYCGVSWSH